MVTNFIKNDDPNQGLSNRQEKHFEWNKSVRKFIKTSITDLRHTIKTNLQR